ncbi:sensor histidine kinase [Curvibacter lanceolatus]|uniref:sensor histidine kinase n=1 Tax=Curvibacter lanceolatus TaxID=86182 RepID=UPI00037A09E4|nr:ATP-binding protein [Curvibacter lanceolatus]
MYKNSQKLTSKWLLALLLLLSCGWLRAGEWIDQLEIGRSIDLGSQLAWQQLIDQTGLATVDSVAAKPDSEFQWLKGPVSEGYTRNVIWLRLTLPSELRNETGLLLQISPPYLDWITLYQSHQGQWIPQDAGDLRPSAERLQTHKFVFRLNPAEPILIRVESSSVMRVYASLWRPNDLLVQTERDGWMLGLYFGLGVSLLVLVTGGAIAFKERRLAATGVLGALTLIHAFNLHGYSNVWLLDQHPALASAMVGLGVFFVAAAVAWFTIELLTRGQKRWRPIHVFLWALCLINLFATLSIPLGCYGRFALLGIISPMLSVFAGTWICGAEIRRHGLNIERGLLLLTYAFQSGNIVLTLAEFTGTRVVMHDTAQIWQFQLLLLLTTATIGIGVGLYQRFEQANAARTQAYHELAKSERMLETRVEERTAELGQAQQTLQMALDHERRMLLEQRQFFSMISHEFRTPLTIIDSAATEQMSFPELDIKRQIEQAAQIRRACRRLSALVDNSLCSERFRAGGLQLVSAEFNLADLVNEATQLVHWSPRHWLDLSLAHDLPVWIGDPTLLRMALSNLIDNAVKYARQGKVGVCAAQDTRGWLQLSVSDQGTGLDHQTQSRIFDKFERGHYNDKAQGFGLGLWITQHVARLHGGEVSLYSEPGRGCTFVIELPPTSLPG